MLSADLLKMLVCPETRQELTLAPDDVVERINGAIAAGKVRNKAGRTLERKLDSALLRSDGAVAYAVVDDIPMMLVDEGIPLDQPALAS